MILGYKWGEYGWGCCLRLTNSQSPLCFVPKLVLFVVSGPTLARSGLLLKEKLPTLSAHPVNTALNQSLLFRQYIPPL